MKQEHSRLGIVSFITSLVAWGLTIWQIGTAFGEDGNSMMAGTFLILFLVVTLPALGFGIVGLIQKDRKKVFALLGTILSAGILIAMIFLIVVNVILSSR